MDTVNHINLVSTYPLLRPGERKTRDIAQCLQGLQTLHPSQVKPVLRALLHAIFFHRTLDNIEPETYEIAESHIVRYLISHSQKTTYLADLVG